MLFETHGDERSRCGLEFSVRVTHVGAAGLVVTPVGEADISTKPYLRKALGEAASAAHRYVIVDLDRLTFMDASTLGALAEASRSIAETGGTMEIRCHKPQALRLLTIGGLSHLVNESAPLVCPP